MKSMLSFALATLYATTAVAQSMNVIWGANPAEAWALGPGAQMRWNGSAWTYNRNTLAMAYNGIAGSSATNIWAVGSQGGAPALARWNGTSWDSVAAPVTSRELLYVAVTPTHVFVIEDTDDLADTLYVHVWNGRAWAREQLPHNLVVAGMKFVGPELWIVGYAYFDPRPQDRNQFGVLMRRVAGRWTTTFTGRRSTDPVIGAASWSHFDVQGRTAMVFGQDSMGPRLLLRRAAAWSRIALPDRYPDRGYAAGAQLLGDGTPVLRWQAGRTDGFLRYDGSTWEPFGGSVVPDLFGSNVVWRYTKWWSPAGASDAHMVLSERMLARVGTGDTRVQAATWCMGAPGGSNVFGGGDAVICQALASAAAAPAVPAVTPDPAPGTKRGTPPAGLPRPRP